MGLIEPGLAAKIAGFHSDERLQTRIVELAARANEGELTAHELAEYEGYVQANRFLAVLQSKARRIAGSGGNE